jgi:hypothetical protein
MQPSLDRGWAFRRGGRFLVFNIGITKNKHRVNPSGLRFDWGDESERLGIFCIMQRPLEVRNDHAHGR